MEFSIASFPRTFAWQSSLLRMGTCHGFVLTSNGYGYAVLICLGGGVGGGGVAFSKKERIVPCLVAPSAWTTSLVPQHR